MWSEQTKPRINEENRGSELSLMQLSAYLPWRSEGLCSSNSNRQIQQEQSSAFFSLRQNDSPTISVCDSVFALSLRAVRSKPCAAIKLHHSWLILTISHPYLTFGVGCYIHNTQVDTACATQINPLKFFPLFILALDHQMVSRDPPYMLYLLYVCTLKLKYETGHRDQRG